MVERWRGIARQVAPEIPAGLVLAIITRESFGRPGALGRSNDNGLMQVKPATVDFYNRWHDRNVDFDRMKDTDHSANTDQIRVGAWYIQHCLRKVHEWNPAAAPWPLGPLTDYQIRLADLCYARGVGGVAKLRRRAIAAGYPDTFDGLKEFREKHDPKWGTPGHPFNHAAAVLKMTRNDGTGDRRPPATLPKPSEPFPWGLLLAGFGVLSGLLSSDDPDQ